jgi:putative transposase
MGEVTERDPAALAAFIGNQKTVHPVPHRLACRVLGVSESRFYKWRDKPTTAAREVRRGQLTDAIRQIFENSGGNYGSPKVWLLLVRAGWRVSVNTVACLMAELGLAGREIRRRGGLTRPGERPVFADFVRRGFTADAPDQVWCGDMTEIATGEGKLHLATVIDPVLAPPARLRDGCTSRRGTRRCVLGHVRGHPWRRRGGRRLP